MSAVKHNVADLIWKKPGSNIELVSMTMQQAISELYVIQAEIRAGDKALAFADMLHADAEIVIKCGDDLSEDRMLSGIITRFSQSRTRHGNLPNATGKNYLYDVEIRPKLWMLTRQVRSKVFQKKNSKDIVAEILGEYGIACQWKLQGSPAPMEYCVQYGESDYDFISRLLEGSGICFFFDQKEKKVIFTNHAGGHPDCRPIADVMYVEEISPRFQIGKQEFLKDFTYAESIGTGSFAVNHYNYETSQTNIKAETTEGKVPCFPEVEHYLHTRNYPDKSAGNDMAILLKEAETARAKVGRGSTSCRSFEAGHAMTITDHFRSSMNCKWILTSCNISMEQGSYQCRFTALPADVPFRPANKTPRPKIFGLQTATVTGPQGAKVYLDEMGRCKLQFHWDREGGKDDRASMWVRVSNNYAGKDYGIQWIPRIGHEVLVTFIDGNPDLPLVTGRVYNDFNSAPLGPANKWQNIIKTIKDNHLIFDDEDGKERIDIRAEKDMETLVVNDDEQTIGNNRTITVGRNHSETIGADMTISVGGSLSEQVAVNYTETVAAMMTLSVGGALNKTVGLSHSKQVGASDSISVGGSRSVSVGAGLSTDVGTDQSVNVGKNHSMDVGSDSTLKVGKKTMVQSGDDLTINGKKKAVIDIKDQLTLKCGSASIILKKNGDIQIKGKKINIKASGDIKMKGSKIAEN